MDSEYYQEKIANIFETLDGNDVIIELSNMFHEIISDFDAEKMWILISIYFYVDDCGRTDISCIMKGVLEEFIDDDLSAYIPKTDLSNLACIFQSGGMYNKICHKLKHQVRD